MEMMLKEMAACPHCRHECYAEDLQGGLCPQCGRPADAESDEPQPRAAPRRRGASGSGSGPRPRRKGSKQKGRPAASSKPKEKAKVILTEDFKRQVFDAFRDADAPRAQQLCFELSRGNEAHAKQVYGHLLGVAKKNDWVGLNQRHPPPTSAPPPAAMPQEALPLPSGILSPHPEPLPLPAGILAPSADLLPLPAGILSPAAHAPLPMPAGILDPLSAPPPAGDPGFGAPAPGLDLTVHLPPGVASGRDLLPPVLPPMPEPVSLSVSTESALTAAQLSLESRTVQAAVPGGDRDPEERGFLGRVAIEGRAAQVSLLCAAGRYAAARDLAQNTLVKNPYAPRGHAALGESLSGLGDDAEALKAYTNAVRADASDPVCIRGYAQILVRMGRYQEAVNAYRRIVGPGKGEMKDAVSLATALRLAGDAQGAKRVTDEVVKRDPQSLEPVRQQAEALLESGNVAGAAGLLRQIHAKEKSPFPLSLTLAESLAGRSGGSAEARIACAEVFTAVGRPFHAVRLLTAYASQNPRDTSARRTLGLAFARLGAGPLAEEQLLGVAKQGAGDLEVFRALGEVYLERGDTASGVRALARARDTDGADIRVRRALARALAAQGELDAAVRELEAVHNTTGGRRNEALEDELDRITERAFTQRVKDFEARLLANDNDDEARLMLARALSQRGDITEAVKHLERASASALDSALAKAEQIAEELGAPQRSLVVLLVKLYEKADTLDKAVDSLGAYLEGAHDDPELKLRMIEICAKSERTQDAADALESFVADATPFYLEAALALGDGLLDRARSSLVHALANGQRRLGQVDKAVSLFRRVLDVEPENTTARVDFAKLLEGAGQLGEAFDVLKVLVADSSGSTAELERLATLALGAGKLEDAVRLLKRAADRHPEDLALTRALEATQARLRDVKIRSLAGSRKPEERLELAGLYAEHGSQNEAIRLLRTLGMIEGDSPELSFLHFSADHFARIGREDKAEAALRQVGRALNYAPGSEPSKDLLYRIGGLYEQAGDRRAARRVLLEVFVLDPAFRDVSTKLEILSQDVGSLATVDERILELVDVGAPLGTIFDAIQGVALSLDPKLLSGGRSSSVVMKIPKETL